MGKRISKFSDVRKKAYLEKLTKGKRRGQAAKEVGISYPVIWKRMKEDAEFAKEVDEAEMLANEEVENALYQAAVSGNVTACQVWLYNRAPDKWADKRQVESRRLIAGRVEHDHVNVNFDFSGMSDDDLLIMTKMFAKMGLTRQNVQKMLGERS